MMELTYFALRDRSAILGILQNLPRADVATDDEVLRFTEKELLFGIGIGIGYSDAHLSAAVRLAHGASLWTRDKHLLTAATRFGPTAGLTHAVQS